MNDFELAEVFPPGEFLRDELDARSWSQSELAEIMGKSVSVINEVLSAKRSVTPEIAQALASALGGSAQFWLNLESIYRLSRLPKDDTVSRRARLHAIAPIREMIRRGWIEETSDLDVLEASIVEFMGEDEVAFAHAARRHTPHDQPTTPTQRAWLCRTRQLAPLLTVDGLFARERVPELVDDLRRLAEAPENIALVPRVMAHYGIRFLMVEALAGTRIDGATFQLGDTPVIALSLRFDRIDHFWHTLLHEVAHVWFGDGTVIDQDIVNGGMHLSEANLEKRADAFASEALVPSEQLDDFVIRVRPLFSSTRIQNFARTMGVHTGIVVGQLQHRREIGYQNLRRTLVPVRDIVLEAALTDGWGDLTFQVSTEGDQHELR